MKKLTYLTVLFHFCIILVSCFTEADQNSTITTAQMKKIIQPLLPKGVQSVSPLFGNNHDSTYVLDLDGDQKVEILGLYRHNDQLGIVVAKKNTQHNG